MLIKKGKSKLKKRRQEQQVEDSTSVKKEKVRKRNWPSEEKESLFFVSLSGMKVNSIWMF